MACPRLRNMLDADQPAFGLWISIADPAVVEIVAYAGFDYVNIDMEHTSLELPMVENMCRAASACGISALVRLPENNAKAILRVVELGPDGIVVPHIRDAEDARQAVSAAKYAPLGERGIKAATRAARYGVDGADFVSYAERINRQLVIYAQIEDRGAIDDVEAIAAVEGLDVCGMGPADLSRALGCMGTKDDPRVGAAIKEVAKTIRRVGKAKLGIPINHSSYQFDAASVIALGAVMINCGNDVRALSHGLSENIRRAKEQLPALA